MRERLLKLLGYMTAREALRDGFTHHGSYYGIPVWVAIDGPDGLVVAAKWGPLEYVMTVLHYIEGILRTVFYPDDEPTFQFLVGKPIDGGAQ